MGRMVEGPFLFIHNPDYCVAAPERFHIASEEFGWENIDEDPELELLHPEVASVLILSGVLSPINKDPRVLDWEVPVEEWPW